MIPKRYLIATLFIAAMLVILAVVQARKGPKGAQVMPADAPIAWTIGTYETLAQYELLEGWTPRFQGTLDPDQPDPWPFTGGFNTPWELASPYLRDRGIALNGPGGKSEVVLWGGLEWRHYRFDAPLCSARLDPAKGRYLLVTLQMSETRFETRLLEVPEGRVLWASDSGPWSRFSWDGKAALFGLGSPGALLLTTRAVDRERTETTLAPWDEKDLPPPPKGWATQPEALWDDGKDLEGHRVLIPWQPSARMWFPTEERLWVSEDAGWALWGLEGGTWRRLEAGAGVLMAQPPLAMGRVTVDEEGVASRQVAPLEGGTWEGVPDATPPWPAWDPGWLWSPDGAMDAWDRRWGAGMSRFLPERQRETLQKSFLPDWRVAKGLRASVKGWLPEGPEVALREAQSIAWVWVGNRILLVRLKPVERLRQVESLLKGL